MKFDEERARIYDQYARISLPGYDALHELAGCLLGSLLKESASVLAVGVGTGQEIITLSRYGSNWQFTGLDPSAEMLQIASMRLLQEGLKDRTKLMSCFVADFPLEPLFDASTLMLVIHFIHERNARLELLRDISLRLKPNAPFILAAGLFGDLRGDSVLIDAWKMRWVSQGISREEIETRFQEMFSSVYPLSETELLELLNEAGFHQVRRFFTSLSFSAWVAQKGG
jgi:tRNA (cmo5U34)-methyltransferase